MRNLQGYFSELEVVEDLEVKDPPKVACVEMIALRRTTTFSGKHKDLATGEMVYEGRKEFLKRERIFIPVRGTDSTLHHIERQRRNKGWVLVGWHNFDKLGPTESDGTKRRVRDLVNGLHAMMNNPEVQREKAANVELQSRIAELEKELAGKAKPKGKGKVEASEPVEPTEAE